MKNLIKLTILLLLVFPVISANGLVVRYPDIDLNKTFGIDKSFNIEIENQDSFSFYNVTIDDIDIEMDSIGEIKSGEIKNATVTYIGDSSAEKVLRVEGFYQATLGTPQDTHSVSITYDNGLSPCDISAIKQDTIKWFNNADRDVKLINADSGAEIATISRDANYTQKFSEPVTLHYYTTWFGFIFSDTCTISVLQDTGLIHDPNLDGFVNLNVNVTYEPTNITAELLVANYTIDPFSQDEGVLLITNTGTKKAKSIKLEGDWFSFSSNNFDLNPSASKSIIYTIKPTLTSTNQTNKQYEKNISIIGNFPALSKKFDIFVNYGDVESQLNSSSDSLLDIIKKYCDDNPDVSFCSNNKIVVGSSNNSDEVNVTVASSQLREIFEHMYNQGEENKNYQTQMKELFYTVNQTLESVQSSQNKTTDDVESLKSQFENNRSFYYFMLIAINVIAIGGLFSYGVYYELKRRKSKKLRTLQ